MFKNKRTLVSIISAVFTVQIITSTVFNPFGLGKVEAANDKNSKRNLPTVS